MDNFFTNLPLLRHLLNKACVQATQTKRANRLANAPTMDIKELQKKSRGPYDVAVDTKSKVAVVQWKNNKVVILLVKRIKPKCW